MAASKKRKHSRRTHTLPWNSPHVMGIMLCTALIRSHELQRGADTLMLPCSVPSGERTHQSWVFIHQVWMTPFQATKHLNWAPKGSCLNLALKGKQFGEKKKKIRLSPCSVFLETEYMRKLKPDRPKILGTLILIKWRKLKIASMKPTVWGNYHLFCVKILCHLKLQKVLNMSFPALFLCGTETSFSCWRHAKQKSRSSLWSGLGKKRGISFLCINKKVKK